MYRLGEFRETRAEFGLQDADEGPPEPTPPVEPMATDEQHAAAMAKYAALRAANPDKER